MIRLIHWLRCRFGKHRFGMVRTFPFYQDEIDGQTCEDCGAFRAKFSPPGAI